MKTYRSLENAIRDAILKEAQAPVPKDDGKTDPRPVLNDAKKKEKKNPKMGDEKLTACEKDPITLRPELQEDKGKDYNAILRRHGIHTPKQLTNHEYNHVTDMHDKYGDAGIKTWIKNRKSSLKERGVLKEDKLPKEQKEKNQRNRWSEFAKRNSKKFMAGTGIPRTNGNYTIAHHVHVGKNHAPRVEKELRKHAKAHGVGLHVQRRPGKTPHTRYVHFAAHGEAGSVQNFWHTVNRIYPKPQTNK